MRNNEGYYKIKHLMESTHTDNMEIFIELIHTKDEMPLFNGVTKKRVCFLTCYKKISLHWLVS